MDEIIKEYNDLVNEIIEHDILYSKGIPKISDKYYDKRYKRLKQLEKNSPDIIREDSPTKSMRHYCEILHNSVVHKDPMKSIENAYNFEDVCKFIDRLKENDVVGVVVEYKIDGVAAAIKYCKGRLQSIATRGDGITGEDVTVMRDYIDFIPITIPYKEDVEFYGEIFISKEDFKILNEVRKNNGENQWATARNLVAGSLRLKDMDSVKYRNLRLAVYSASRNTKMDTQEGLNVFIDKCGFYSNESLGLVSCANGIQSIYLDVLSKRESLKFEIDGVVIKSNDITTREKVGSLDKVHKWQIAYKMPETAYESQVLDIVFRIGTTGKITPIACLKPVKIDGVIVSRATLHNLSEIFRLDVRVGDFVLVARGGDVIPKILSVLKEKRNFNSNVCEIPMFCPGCGSMTITSNDMRSLKCSKKESCPHVFLEMVKKYVSRDFLDIKNLGDKVINKLVESGIVSSLKDIYIMSLEQLSSLEGLGPVAAKNIIDSVDKSKFSSVHKFLAALCIEGVGIVIARKLMERFGELKNLMHASLEDILKVEGLGPIVANNVYRFFKVENNVKEVRELEKLEAFNSVYKNGDKNGYYKTFAITGSFKNLDRKSVVKIIESKNWVFSSSVTKKCDAVICGENPGSKREKAIEMNIPIITIEDFMRI